MLVADFIQERSIKMKNKQAQLKIQEMSFMLLGLILFFVLAGVFFVILSNTGIKQTASRLSEAGAIATVSTLAGSPEFEADCGTGLCIDMDKLIVLKSIDGFDNYWNIDGLVIRKVYPYDDSGEIECNTGNYKNCNKITLVTPGSSYVEASGSSYVSLCRKEEKGDYIYDKCDIAIISAYISKE